MKTAPSTGGARMLLGRLPRRLLGAILLVLAGLWLAYVIRGNLAALRTSWASLQPARIAAALLPATLSRYFVALAYWLVLKRIQPATPRFGEFVTPFFASQVVRYLPGKVWALAYQANAWSTWLRLTQVWEANLVWLLIVGLNGVLVPACVWVAVTYSAAVGAVGLASTAVGLFAALKVDGVGRVMARFSARSGRGTASRARRGPDRSAAVVVLLELEWLAYFVAFAFLVPARMPLVDVVLIAAAYGLAWVLGLLVLILPDGILVREALFVAVGRQLGYPVPDLLLVSAVARVVFVVMDVLALLTAATWRLWPEAGKEGPR